MKRLFGIISTGALLALGIVLGTLFLAPAAAYAADPALDTTEVTHPCTTTPPNDKTIQIPGSGIEGQEGCSGNFQMPFSVGGIILTYNSQFATYNPSQTRSLQPSFGFGRGMRAVSDLLVSSSGDITVTISDGSVRSFRKTATTKWRSSDYLRGDASIIQGAAGAYELQLLPSAAKIRFDVRIAGRFYPSSYTSATGQQLSYTYDTSKSLPILTAVTDVATGKKITLTLADDNLAVANITDERQRVYTLVYSGAGNGRFLTGIILPDSSRYTLGYDTNGQGYLTSVRDPVGQDLFISYYEHGRLRGVGTATGSTRYTYTNNSVTTQFLNQAGAALSFQRTRFVNGYVSEYRSGNGAPATGVLMAKVLRDPIGRVTESSDQFGSKEKFHYNENQACLSNVTAPGTSPLPTCVEANGIKTQIKHGADTLPTEMVRTDKDGNTATLAFIWQSGRPTSLTIKDGRDRTTMQRTVVYQGAYPAEVRVKSSVYLDEYDTAVKGRLRRRTGSDGLESVVEYAPNGTVASTNVGGLTTTYTRNLQSNGAINWKMQSDGVQEELSSNFLGTQTSSSVAQIGANPNSQRAQASLAPRIGGISSTVTARVTGAGGQISAQESKTSTIDSAGIESSTGSLQMNIQ